MIIYRLEGNSGYGAINHDLALSGDDIDAYNHILISRNRIMPREYAYDFDNFNKDIHYFGCSSMEQLGLWFNDRTIEELKPFGVSVVMYEVDDHYVTKSEVQVMFEMRHATKINERSAVCAA